MKMKKNKNWKRVVSSGKIQTLMKMMKKAPSLTDAESLKLVVSASSKKLPSGCSGVKKYASLFSNFLVGG